ncbi:DNA primase [uncultured Capnocytophaga sp.]|jgi:DNA primase|uniref:DNA primase n=1 Tax=uncultured Capnocytophaga sp. TaxID=159273 RepID=UPI0028E77FF5|nr:DNA primase [uncultured Capnocytophaga sp.]
MITKESIDKVYDAIRIEEVIGDFVQLKRAGSGYKGLSPFTNERTPSFSVSPSKQIWKDFSSGKGGNAIAFLMEHEHFSYIEAIRYLAKKYNIELEETELNDEEKEKANEKEKLFLANDFARDFFHQSLLESEEGKAIGMTYFKERAFTDETIKTFQLGYAIDQKSAFTDTALKKGIKLESLEKTGLTIVDEQQHKLDRFRGRVIFPILSMSGRVLGFGGRILSTEKKLAKYLNSPESEIYHKSNILYGLFQAKSFISKEDNCYLVEGYADVIQLYQRGIKNTVASSGTALTQEQIRLIHRFTPNITILYDGDSAGLKAALRAGDMILAEGMNARICTFPDGDDPDSFAKKNPLEDILEYFKENIQDFIRFKASLLIKEANNDPLKRADTIRNMIESISKISDNIKKEIYIRECAQIMDISEQVLFASLSQISQQQLLKADKELQRSKKEPKPLSVIVPQEINPILTLEKELIRYLLLYGLEECTFEEKFLFFDKETGEEKTQIFSQKMKVFEKLFLELQADEIELSTPEFRDFYTFFMKKFQEGLQDTSSIINEIPLEIANQVASFQAQEESLHLDKWFSKKGVVVKSKIEELPYTITGIILNLRKRLIDNKIKTLKEEISILENEDKDPSSIFLEVIEYNTLKNTIVKRLGWNM